MNIKKRLDEEVLKRNSLDEINQDNLDPIMVAHRHNDPTIALICALFAYGNVKQIVKFLDSLDFDLLQADDVKIQATLKNHYYRFQKGEDVVALFIALKRLSAQTSLESVFQEAYNVDKNLIEGINACISKILSLNSHKSQGYNFLVGKVTLKTKGAGALKRWMMYLRWMVRDDNIDMGLWSGVDRADLIMPLDTHTFKVGHKLGLLKRKTYDLEAAIELTKKLKSFDKNDPLKYDFALYRLGQEKKV
ncbi:MAG TPA: TIGR02757 family protein [Sulfurimonas sp.]|nr:TIGR02757 family protein [Sulfurimonas sp.]HIM75850.1 TIGR02757 family protein [Campylobacterales bacterium]